MSFRRRQRLLDPGTRVPDARFTRLEGGEATIQEIVDGGPVLLVFFKDTCPVCQFTLPYLERIHAPGVLPVYGVSQNDARTTRAFNTRFRLTFPTLLDPEKKGFPASNAFGISTVPTLFLVEREGVISRVTEGWSRKEMEWLGGKAGVAPFRQGDNVPEWKAG